MKERGEKTSYFVLFNNIKVWSFDRKAPTCSMTMYMYIY